MNVARCARQSSRVRSLPTAECRDRRSNACRRRSRPVVHDAHWLTLSGGSTGKLGDDFTGQRSRREKAQRRVTRFHVFAFGLKEYLPRRGIATRFEWIHIESNPDLFDTRSSYFHATIKRRLRWLRDRRKRSTVKNRRATASVRIANRQHSYTFASLWDEYNFFIPGQSIQTNKLCIFEIPVDECLIHIV